MCLTLVATIWMFFVYQVKVIRGHEVKSQSIIFWYLQKRLSYLYRLFNSCFKSHFRKAHGQ